MGLLKKFCTPLLCVVVLLLLCGLLHTFSGFMFTLIIGSFSGNLPQICDFELLHTFSEFMFTLSELLHTFTGFMLTLLFFDNSVSGTTLPSVSVMLFILSTTHLSADHQVIYIHDD